MIRRCMDSDFALILSIINDGAQPYRGVIPADRWEEPYMSAERLQYEVEDGVIFWGYEQAGELSGVMGMQLVKDVTLIRHAYVRRAVQKQGVGRQLLTSLLGAAKTPVLVGTWAAAHWAIDFYKRHGFAVVAEEEKNRLLETYWTISRPTGRDLRSPCRRAMAANAGDPMSSHLHRRACTAEAARA